MLNLEPGVHPVSESERKYTYLIDGVPDSFHVEARNVISIEVFGDGTHRLKTKNGGSIFVRPGWVTLQITPVL